LRKDETIRPSHSVGYSVTAGKLLPVSLTDMIANVFSTVAVPSQTSSQGPNSDIILDHKALDVLLDLLSVEWVVHLIWWFLHIIEEHAANGS
jgi:hypothetical protein